MAEAAAGGTGVVVAETGVAPGEVEKPQEGLPKVAGERKLAPIPEGKGKTSLPGVFKRNEDENSIPLLRPGRAKDGKFLSQKDKEDRAEEELFGDGDEPQEVDPEETSAPGEAAVDKDKVNDKPALPGDKAPVVVGKISLGGKEYESLEKADQAHRTLQGMFKPLTEILGPNPGDWNGKVQELKSAATLKQERDYGYEAANAWERVAIELAENGGDVAKIRELAQKYKLNVRGVGSGKPQAAATQAGQSNTDLASVMDKVDLGVFENLTINGGLKAGGKYLVEQILAVVQNDLLGNVRAEVAAKFAPQEAQEQEAQIARSTEAVLDRLINLRTADGQEAFPELKDPKLVHEIGLTWRNQNLPPDAALSDQGLMSAVALWRMLKGFEPKLPVVANPQTQPRQNDGPAPAAAASLEGDESGSPLGRGQRSNMSPEARRFSNALKDTSWIDSNLGFTPRPKHARQ